MNHADVTIAFFIQPEKVIGDLNAIHIVLYRPMSINAL